MSFATLFSDLAAGLFGQAAIDTKTVEPQLVSMGVEAVVDAVDPRLRTMPGYSKKLAPFIAPTIVHLRELAALLPAPRTLSRGAWSSDALLNAVFAAADDVSVTLG